MKLKCINLPASDPKKTSEFYSLILDVPYQEIVPGRFEVPVGEGVVLAVTKAVPTPSSPQGCGLEFITDDIEREYKRLTNAGVFVEKPPVTLPWNYRYFSLKDPDQINVDIVQYLGK